MKQNLHLIVLCGLPFSGKSTLAQAINERLGVQIVAVDKFHDDRRVFFDGRSLQPNDWLAAFRWAYRRLRIELGAEQSVVFDSTAHRKRDRARLYRFANRNQAISTLILLDVPTKEARRRLAANQANPTRPNVPRANFDQIANEFEYPDLDETVLTYDGTSSPEEWIEAVLLPRLNEIETVKV